MSDFKQGDIVEVTNSGRGDWDRAVFIGLYLGEPVCALECANPDDEHAPQAYNHIRALKEPEYIPYTQETLPKGSLWLRPKAGVSEFQVMHVGADGVWSRMSFIDYGSLTDLFDISEDGRRSYHAAGVEVKP